MFLLCCYVGGALEKLNNVISPFGLVLVFLIILIIVYLEIFSLTDLPDVIGPTRCDLLFRFGFVRKRFFIVEIIVQNKIL